MRTFLINEHLNTYTKLIIWYSTKMRHTNFNLIYNWFNFAGIQNLLNLGLVKVGHSNRLREAKSVCFFHTFPRLQEVCICKIPVFLELQNHN